ncbi:MAG: hypothetical protein AVDCRST_MAG22-2633, partial [uncultured Rubrobacteraceae bacterium]
GPARLQAWGQRVDGRGGSEAGGAEGSCDSGAERGAVLAVREGVGAADGEGLPGLAGQSGEPVQDRGHPGRRPAGRGGASRAVARARLRGGLAGGFPRGVDRGGAGADAFRDRGGPVRLRERAGRGDPAGWGIEAGGVAAGRQALTPGGRGAAGLV